MCNGESRGGSPGKCNDLVASFEKSDGEETGNDSSSLGFGIANAVDIYCREEADVTI